MLRWSLWGLLCVALAACASAGVSLGERLGLPEDQPAFLFFYTDN